MIYYKHGNYKYILSRDSVEYTGIYGYEVKTDFIELLKNGTIIIRKGYAWDGCSGPTIDTKKNMRAGLVHDALYQLMRMGLLPATCRPLADKRFKEILIEDRFYAPNLYYFGVSMFAGFAIKAKEEPKEQTAP